MSPIKVNIKINIRKCTLSLSSNGAQSDAISFSYYHNLSGELIKGLDILIKKNRIDRLLLMPGRILTQLNSGQTSYNIAKAFMLGLRHI